MLKAHKSHALDPTSVKIYESLSLARIGAAKNAQLSLEMHKFCALAPSGGARVRDSSAFGRQRTRLLGLEVVGYGNFRPLGTRVPGIWALSF